MFSAGVDIDADILTGVYNVGVGPPEVDYGLDTIAEMMDPE